MQDSATSKDAAVENAAELIRRAGALVICSGAGMGVDSGLPDFRGTQGFWTAYPLFQKKGLTFSEIANPRWFIENPAQAWGFYGHRLSMYRRTRPHAGFGVLLSWALQAPLGCAVYTSNVDGHFQKAGFSEQNVVEAHGSIHFLQCLAECGASLFAADPFNVDVDESTLLARDPLPTCPRCGALARPNILMFDDVGWNRERSSAQGKAIHAWLKKIPDEQAVVIECGAGTSIPTIRFFTQQVILSKKAKVVRINPRDEGLLFEDDGIAIRGGAQESLRRIADCMKDKQQISSSAAPI